MRRSTVFLAPLLPVLLQLSGCTSKPEGTILLTTGGEDAGAVFAEAPTPTTIEVDFTDYSSGKQAALFGPAAVHRNVTLDLGSRDYSSIGELSVSLSDEKGERVMYGQSIPMQLGALESAQIGLFVQRVGETARMPAHMADVWNAPVLMLFDGQYIVAAGGSIGAVSATDAGVPAADAGFDAALPDASPEDAAGDASLDALVDSASDAAVDATSDADVDATSDASDATVSDATVSDAAAAVDSAAAVDADGGDDGGALPEPTYDAGVADAAASDATLLDMYDLFAYQPVTGLPTLPFVPTSLAQFQGALLLFNQDAASYINFSSSGDTIAAIGMPDGGLVGDIAGGQTIVVPGNQTQFIVGATRLSGPPTTSVLVLDPSGNLTYLHTNVARVGASAAWFDGVGLVISGGATEGPGIELFPVIAGDAGASAPVAATLATAQGYGSDSTFGGAALPLSSDATHLLLVGGITADGKDPGVRVVTLPCSTACIPVLWSGAAQLPSTLVPTQLFEMQRAASPTAGNALVVVGDDPTGRTRLFELSSDAGATEIATKVPRVHARAVALDSATVGLAIVGGDTTAAAPTVESFLP